jgi:hypothetical protein
VQNWLKSAPPESVAGVVGVAVVGVGVEAPPVFDGVVGVAVGVGVTAVPPEEDVLGVVVVDVVVVAVVLVVPAAGVVVEPDGGAVRAGVVSGTS